MITNATLEEEMIEFKNMHGKIAGNGIRELRKRQGLSREAFAAKAHLPPDFRLDRLEEGYELKVSVKNAKNILEAGGIRFRRTPRKPLRKEELLNILLSISPAIPPCGLI